MKKLSSQIISGEERSHHRLVYDIGKKLFVLIREAFDGLVVLTWDECSPQLQLRRMDESKGFEKIDMA